MQKAGRVNMELIEKERTKSRKGVLGIDWERERTKDIKSALGIEGKAKYKK